MKRLTGCRGSPLGTLEIKIHYDWILPAAHHDGFAWLISPRIDLLVWNIGRHVNEVTWAGFIDKLQPVSPPHASPAPNNVEHRLEIPMMMRPRFGIRRYKYGTGP
jgi:hypothetical protein